MKAAGVLGKILPGEGRLSPGKVGVPPSVVGMVENVKELAKAFVCSFLKFFPKVTAAFRAFTILQERLVRYFLGKNSVSFVCVRGGVILFGGTSGGGWRGGARGGGRRVRGRTFIHSRRMRRRREKKGKSGLSFSGMFISFR
jgi:hypothetical protein